MVRPRKLDAPQVRSETVVETPFEAGGHVVWYGSLASLGMTNRDGSISHRG